jgi:branched-subunit amino acid permease
MDKNELIRHIQKYEQLHERRKLKRFGYTVLFYTAVLFGICYLQNRLAGATVWDILGEILLCVILSCVCVLVNSIIFHQLFKMEQDEQAAIDYLKKRLREKEKEETHKKEML